MTTSTPPAWNWLHECLVPVEAPGLSVCPRKLPDSATLGERNDSPDPAGEDIWPLGRAVSQAVNAPDAGNSAYVESCPECGTVTDIEYGTVKDKPPDCQAYEPEPVPFLVQEFMFEELCEEKLAELPHLIFTHSERIIEMARDRFRKGYAKYGSAMYSWSPERRLDETLQELADAVVYLTSGNVE